MPVVWHGSEVESLELQAAIARNCGCTYGMMGVRTSTCAPHEALLNQRFLDDVLFLRRIKLKLLEEEMAP